MDLIQQAHQIFSQPPQEKSSIQLVIEEADNEIVHEMLLTILMEGITRLGYIKENKIDLGNNDIATLKDYFASFGFFIGLNTSENLEEKNYFSRIKIQDNKYQLLLNPLHFFREGINKGNRDFFVDENYLNCLTSIIDQDTIRFHIFFAYLI